MLPPLHFLANAAGARAIMIDSYHSSQTLKVVVTNLFSKHRRMRANVDKKQSEYVTLFRIEKQQIILHMTLTNSCVFTLELMVIKSTIKRFITT